MKTLLAALFFLISLPATAGDESLCPASMTKGVENQLHPVLGALAVVKKSGDWFDPRYEASLTKLLQSKDPAAVEARVALMDYYTGEHTGEDLVCAVARDGASARKFLELYAHCNISPSHSQVSRDHNLPLRRYALEIIKKGNGEQSCTYD